MADEFLSVMEGTSSTTEEKKSLFFAHLKMTRTVEEADAFIRQMKDENKGHTCPSAYIVGDSGEHQRVRDHGEPSGTGGHPILEALKKHNVVNATAVVSRKWGGTLLGANRLKMFYGGAVDKAIQELGLAIYRLQQEVHFQVDYHFAGLVEKELTESDWVKVSDIQYGAQVSFTCYVDQDNLDRFKEETANLTNGTGQYDYGQEVYTPYPIEEENK